jgi:hypothetical protein
MVSEQLRFGFDPARLASQIRNSIIIMCLGIIPRRRAFLECNVERALRCSHVAYTREERNQTMHPVKRPLMYQGGQGILDIRANSFKDPAGDGDYDE